ncbi:hypothetical protein [Lysobacter gummosus]|uniref:hypothetical protein n=1 Tax=Lysobacter gummosus TaxID=262324 RepID=UPI0036349DC1
MSGIGRHHDSGRTKGKGVRRRAARDGGHAHRGRLRPVHGANARVRRRCRAGCRADSS